MTTEKTFSESPATPPPVSGCSESSEALIWGQTAAILGFAGLLVSCADLGLILTRFI